jgi:Beta-L-arabinofuranosidase, GH127 catalytic domain
LLGGPFAEAQAANIAYIKRLDTDRLLHVFRVNAGLPSTATPLGGWEDPICELRGHFVGHYLSGCALGFAAIGDVELKRRGDRLIAGLAECRLPTGRTVRSSQVSGRPELSVRIGGLRPSSVVTGSFKWTRPYGTDSQYRSSSDYQSKARPAAISYIGTVAAAQAVMEDILKVYDEPAAAVRARSANMHSHDILRNFGESCRAELAALS